MPTNEEITNWFTNNPGATDSEIRSAMDLTGVTVEQMAEVTGVDVADVQSRYDAAGSSAAPVEMSPTETVAENTGAVLAGDTGAAQSESITSASADMGAVTETTTPEPSSAPKTLQDLAGGVTDYIDQGMTAEQAKMQMVSDLRDSGMTDEQILQQYTGAGPAIENLNAANTISELGIDLDTALRMNPDVVAAGYDTPAGFLQWYNQWGKDATERRYTGFTDEEIIGVYENLRNEGESHEQALELLNEAGAKYGSDLSRIEPLVGGLADKDYSTVDTGTEEVTTELEPNVDSELYKFLTNNPAATNEEILKFMVSSGITLEQGAADVGLSVEDVKTWLDTPADTGSNNPYGFTPPSGDSGVTQALVNWINTKTGEKWTASTGGWTPPSGDWVKDTGTDEVTDEVTDEPPQFTPVEGTPVTAGGLPEASQVGAYSGTTAGQTVEQALTQPSTVIPEAAKQTYTQQNVQTNEIMTGKQMAAPTAVTASQITPEELSPVPNMTATEVKEIQDIAAASYEAAMTGNIPDLTAATTGAPSKLVTAAQGEITALAEAAQGTMPVSALMSNQVEQLLQTANGEDYPSWALPAVRAAENALAARGLGRSSIAKEALMSSIINATLPIAQSNAAALQQDYLANLNNRQQAAITNANNLAQMDLANLNANQQAQVENAKAFLSIDLANLTNQQQANVVNAQIRQQNMLSDQAATNAAAQFNAANQQQADQFMANLNTSIAQNNAARTDAASQYNSQLAQQRAALDVANQLEADRITAQLKQTADQFNAQLDFNRDQFNVQNAIAIEQSNVQWRRQVNTANTAGVNAVNQANAMNAFNLSNQALTLLWQENRDAANWAFQSAQNTSDQQARLAIAALGNEAIKEQSDVDLITSLTKSAVTLYLDK